MKKIRKIADLFKSNRKIVVSFLLGVILSGTTVYAAAIIASADVSYSNTASGLTSTDVQSAIDELSHKMLTHCPDGYECVKKPTETITGNFAFGNPTTSSSTDYSSVLKSNNTNVLMRLNNSVLNICIYINNSLKCMDASNAESTLSSIMGSSSCTDTTGGNGFINAPGKKCSNSSFSCSIFPRYNYVECSDLINKKSCNTGYKLYTHVSASCKNSVS